MAHRSAESIDVAAPVEAVLDVALTVDDVLYWFPLPLEAVEVPADGRLAAGDSAVADVVLVGRHLRTRIAVLEADGSRYRLSATGPLDFTVDARLEATPGGCRIEAEIETRSGGGLEGRVLVTASRPLLGPGLRRALDRISERAAARAAGLAAG